MSAPDDRGSITGFTACIVFTLVLCAGLVFDGGRMVAAWVQAADLAENAARAGAQEIVDIRAGDWRIDPARASARAQRYLGDQGVTGQVTATESNVSVTVEQTTTMTLLRLVGISSRSVSVTRAAEAVDR